MPVRVLVVQPAPHAPVHRLGAWWRAAGLELEVLSPSDGDRVPSTLEHDALVVMGGSMGANDDAEFPWLTDIKVLLADACASGAPTLGVCLGHQLLAVALGGTVVPNEAGLTAGLRPVRVRPDAGEDPLHGVLAPGATAVQWNHDIVVDLPPAATLIAASPDDSAQAYRVGDRAWGVQFHPEADVVGVRDWAMRDVADGELPVARAEELLGDIEAADAALVGSWRPWAERFAAVVADHARRHPRGQ